MLDKTSSVDDGGGKVLVLARVLVLGDRDADKLMGCAESVEPVKDSFGKRAPVSVS